MDANHLQVGDTVRFVETDEFFEPHYTLGDIYKVNKVGTIGAAKMVQVKTNTGTTEWTYPYRWERVEQPEQIEFDGGSTPYYEIPQHASELRHLISHKDMSFSRGNIFKACYRIGEKHGIDVRYDLLKMRLFIDDLIEMHERGERI